MANGTYIPTTPVSKSKGNMKLKPMSGCKDTRTVKEAIQTSIGETGKVAKIIKPGKKV